MSDRPTRELMALIVTVVLGVAIIIALTAVVVVEMVDANRDLSVLSKYLGTLLSALAFGVAGYLLGLHRNGKPTGGE